MKPRLQRLSCLIVVVVIGLVSLSLQNSYLWRAYDKIQKNQFFFSLRERDMADTETDVVGPIHTSNHQDSLVQENRNKIMKTQSTLRNTTAKNVDNQAGENKLAEIKKELNDSVLTKESMFPAKRIGRYLLLNPDHCAGVDRVDIVIIVHTAPSHFEKRQRIRDSFGQSSSFYPFIVRTAFLLGKTDNTTLEWMLKMEHARYNDTVMGDFKDNYRNLTIKGVMGCRWVSQHCSNSRFVLKIDDDVLVNMFKLLYSFLSHMSGKKKSIFCNLWHKGRSLIRRTGQWKVDSHIFSSRKTFPYDYCSGFVVIMTTDLMKPMYEAAMTTPFFWIDDVYLFGMLPFMVGGVTYYNYGRFSNMTFNEQVAINCTRSHGSKCPIFATNITDGNYWSYWDMIKGLYVSNPWKVNHVYVQ